MHIHDIRSKSQFEEIDYIFLQDILRHYAEPRLKIKTLLASKALLRIKKGLYVFGPSGARGPYCKEHLANLIYGPSAISLEYALSYHGWIPEKVEVITNITLGRNKVFETPVGVFIYKHISATRYPEGIKQIDLAGRKILMATPEKALLDLLVLSKIRFQNAQALKEHLFQNLRINEDLFWQAQSEFIKLAKHYRSTRLPWQWINQLI